MQVPYVREYNEDRAITAWLPLDMSLSMEFGSGRTTKRTMLAEATAVLARLMVREGEPAGIGDAETTLDSAIEHRRSEVPNPTEGNVRLECGAVRSGHRHRDLGGRRSAGQDRSPARE
jgi:hypothetical protein